MADIKELARAIDSLTLSEAKQLATILIEEYGYTLPSQTVTAEEVREKEEEEEEQTEFNVVLMNTLEGSKKLQAVKELNKVLNLGLKTTKELLEQPIPNIIMNKVSKSEAMSVAEMLAPFGAQTEIK